MCLNPPVLNCTSRSTEIQGPFPCTDSQSTETPNYQDQAASCSFRIVRPNTNRFVEMTVFQTFSPLLIPITVVFLSLTAISIHLSHQAIFQTFIPHLSHPISSSSCTSHEPLLQTEPQLQTLITRKERQLDTFLASHKTFFATYGNFRYRQTRTRLARQAHASKFFNGGVHVFEPRDLPASFSRHFRAILTETRGGGYWVWKYHVVSRMLQKMAWGDFLVYMDADCTINPHGAARFQDYLRLVNVSSSGSLGFSNGAPERWWTTDKLFHTLGLSERGTFGFSNHLISGVMIFQKTRPVMNMLRLWKTVIFDDPYISTDVYNMETTRPDFREHRHDQSILSLVRKCVGTVAIPVGEIKRRSTRAPLQISAIKG